MPKKRFSAEQIVTLLRQIGNVPDEAGSRDSTGKPSHWNASGDRVGRGGGKAKRSARIQALPAKPV